MDKKVTMATIIFINFQIKTQYQVSNITGNLKMKKKTKEDRVFYINLYI